MASSKWFSFSIAVLNAMTKDNLENEIFLWVYHFQWESTVVGKEGHGSRDRSQETTSSTANRKQRKPDSETKLWAHEDCPQGHTSPQKSTSPKPPQIVPSPREQVLKYMGPWGTVLFQTTTNTKACDFFPSVFCGNYLCHSCIGHFSPNLYLLVI